MEKVGSGSLKGIDFSSCLYKNQIIHYLKITSKIGFEERIPMYEATLALNKGPYFFCIFDNSNRLENNLSFDDLMVFNRMILDAGITHYYSASVTFDDQFGSLINLATVTSKSLGLFTEMVIENDVQSAEKFIKDTIDKIMD